MTYNIPNSTDIIIFNQQLSAEATYLYPSILFFIFMVIGVGSYLIQSRRNENTKLLSSLVVGGIVTTIISTLMTIAGGLISIDVTYACAGLTAILILASYMVDD